MFFQFHKTKIPQFARTANEFFSILIELDGNARGQLRRTTYLDPYKQIKWQFWP
jgi:hypothetical protein